MLDRMIAVFYVADPTDWKRASLLSLPQGLGVTIGGVLLSIFGSKIRHWQWQHTVAITVMVIFGALLALGNPNNMAMMCAFTTLSLIGYGWAIYLCIAITQVSFEDNFDTTGERVLTERVRRWESTRRNWALLVVFPVVFDTQVERVSLRCFRLLIYA